jgi:hypothetical protein
MRRAAADPARTAAAPRDFEIKQAKDPGIAGQAWHGRHLAESDLFLMSLST